MGFYWTRDVYEAFGGRADIDKEEMAILVAIAHCMNDHDSHSFPSTSTLMRMTHIGRTTIFNRLNSLQEKGVLVYRSGGFHNGVRYANEYCFVFPTDFVPKPRKGGVKSVKESQIPNDFIHREDDEGAFRCSSTSGPSVCGFDFPEDGRSRPLTIVGELMDFCRTSSFEDRKTFTSLTISRGVDAVRRLLNELRDKQARGKLRNIDNMAAFVTKLLKALPPKN